MTEQAFAAIHVPTWRERILKRMGFRYPYVERPDEPMDGFADGYSLTRVCVSVDWRDRLRILVSGRCMIEALILTDKPIDRMAVITDFTVPPDLPKRL